MSTKNYVQGQEPKTPEATPEVEIEVTPPAEAPVEPAPEETPAPAEPTPA